METFFFVELQFSYYTIYRLTLQPLYLFFEKHFLPKKLKHFTWHVNLTLNFLYNSLFRQTQSVI